MMASPPSTPSPYLRQPMTEALVTVFVEDDAVFELEQMGSITLTVRRGELGSRPVAFYFKDRVKLRELATAILDHLQTERGPSS